MKMGLLKDLNEEQRAAASCEDRRVLVLAGAGSGKTRTLIQKILHLIYEQNIDPGNILAITFTKNAANELLDRLIMSCDSSGRYKSLMSKKHLANQERHALRQEYLSKYPWLANITVRTFHSLCYHILRRHSRDFDNRFRVIASNDYDWDVGVKSQVTENQFEILQKLLKEECEDTAYLLELKRYILDYYVEKERLKKRRKGFGSYEKPYVALDGTHLRSKSERCIADWCFRHNIEYVYEPEIQFADFQFNPDFYIPSANVFLEHVSNRSAPMKDKEDQFTKAGRLLIRTYEPMMRDLRSFFTFLDQNIIPRLVRKQSLALSLRYEEEIRRLAPELRRFLGTVQRVIDMIKIERLSPETIFENAARDDHERVSIFYRLARPLILGYKKYCVRRSYLDFNDLIDETNKLFENHKDIKNYYQNKYQFILVDEYQDVNTSQVDLIKHLLTNKNQLFCVGDDWQSIYGFRGSDVGYIINFKNHFPESTIITLPLNYRSHDTIVEASNKFIKHNKYQIAKEIRALKSEGKKIYLYCAQKEKEDGVEKAIKIVRNLYKKGFTKDDILFLYRRRDQFVPYAEAFKNAGLRITNRTIHGAKGLEAKIVFIIGLRAGFGGFPNIWESDRIFQIIKKSNFELLMEEERRLFYVAMTRAKQELFLVSELGNESEFVKEIPEEFIDRENLLTDIENTEQTCRRCNATIPTNFNFCPYCGDSLHEPEGDFEQSGIKDVKLGIEIDDSLGIEIVDSSGQEETNSSCSKRQTRKLTGLEILKIMKTQKERANQRRERERVVHIHRHQVSTNRPAIARLEITIPHSVDPRRVLRTVVEWNKQVRTQGVEVRQIRPRYYHVDLGASKFMYSRAEKLIKLLKRHCGDDYTVEDDGAWEKWG